MLRILSSPRILTLDNREARISQGTLIPFSQVSAQGVQTTFQEAKLQLLVKPHVTADGSVSMHVKINRDEPDFNQTIRTRRSTILKREAETDLLVMDGPHRGHRRYLHSQYGPQLGPRSHFLVTSRCLGCFFNVAVPATREANS